MTRGLFLCFSLAAALGARPARAQEPILVPSPDGGPPQIMIPVGGGDGGPVLAVPANGGEAVLVQRIDGVSGPPQGIILDSGSSRGSSRSGDSGPGSGTSVEDWNSSSTVDIAPRRQPTASEKARLADRIAWLFLHQLTGAHHEVLKDDLYSLAQADGSVAVYKLGDPDGGGRRSRILLLIAGPEALRRASFALRGGVMVDLERHDGEFSAREIWQAVFKKLRDRAAELRMRDSAQGVAERLQERR